MICPTSERTDSRVSCCEAGRFPESLLYRVEHQCLWSTAAGAPSMVSPVPLRSHFAQARQTKIWYPRALPRLVCTIGLISRQSVRRPQLGPMDRRVTGIPVKALSIDPDT